MINVEVRTSNNIVKSISISGHSGSATKSKDLICAGVSAICFGSINYFIEVRNPNIQTKKEDNFIEFINLSKSENFLHFVYCQLKTLYNSFTNNINWHEK